MASFPTPVTPTGLDDVEVIATGAFHACAARSSGDVYCWGANDEGQLGLGDRTQRSAPTLVMGVQATALAAGAAHTCALTPGGDVYCWGRGDSGQNGSAGRADRLIPEPVTSLDSSVMRATELRAGSNHGCAGVGGWLACWGEGGLGQLGRGEAIDYPDAFTILDPLGFGTITSYDVGGDFSCVVATSGTVSCWGDNASGQLGVGGAGSFRSTASARVIDASAVEITATHVAVGLSHACAITSTGVLCWGTNTWGEIGDGTWLTRLTATPIRE